MAKAAQKLAGESESMQGYFRAIYKENKKLLRQRSNQPLYDRWLADHPGHKEVPEAVKNALNNLKTTLRKKLKMRKKRRVAAAAAGQAEAAAPARAPRRAGGSLEALEHRIDDCLVMAFNLDAQKLDEVIALLRKARNEIVLKRG